MEHKASLALSALFVGPSSCLLPVNRERALARDASHRDWDRRIHMGSCGDRDGTLNPNEILIVKVWGISPDASFLSFSLLYFLIPYWRHKTLRRLIIRCL